MVQSPESWLRGPIPNLPLALQPVGHALIGSLEDVQAAVEGLSREQLWHMPGGAAPIGFHLLHLAGSTDRLFTTARGGTLSDAQRKALADERSIPDPPPALTELLAAWGHVVQLCLEHLSQVIDARLDESRLVGRAQLPSTVRGLLFHAAEHAQRHTGQIITTSKIMRRMNL